MKLFLMVTYLTIVLPSSRTTKHFSTSERSLRYEGDANRHFNSSILPDKVVERTSKKLHTLKHSDGNTSRTLTSKRRQHTPQAATEKTMGTTTRATTKQFSRNNDQAKTEKPSAHTKFTPNFENCQGKKYCEKAGREYPTDHIKKQLKMKGRSREVKMFLKMNGKQELNATRKDAWFPLCDSKLSIIRPKIARNKQRKWMYIVNLDEHFRQQFFVETCRHTGDCNMRDQFPIGYTFTCTQRYVYRQMAAIDIYGRPILDYFEIPSACACFYNTMSHQWNHPERRKVSSAVVQRKGTVQQSKERKDKWANEKQKNERKKKL